MQVERRTAFPPSEASAAYYFSSECLVSLLIGAWQELSNNAVGLEFGKVREIEVQD
jgi:hypothetical protein